MTKAEVYEKNAFHFKGQNLSPPPRVYAFSLIMNKKEITKNRDFLATFTPSSVRRDQII